MGRRTPALCSHLAPAGCIKIHKGNLGQTQSGLTPTDTQKGPGPRLAPLGCSLNQKVHRVDNQGLRKGPFFIG